MIKHNLIEHVARAIDPEAWEMLGSEFAALYREQSMRDAEAAIAAVREWEKANDGRK